MCKFAPRRKGRTKGTPEKAFLLPPSSLIAAKTAYEKAKQALEAMKLAATTEGAKAFKLYGNLLSDEARQPWGKVILARTTKCPWEDVHGVTHDETPTKTWDSFMECVTLHLQQVFRHDTGKRQTYPTKSTVL